MNARPKLVPIELDKARNLLFDFNALAKAEEVSGRNYLDGDVWDNISATDVRALIYGGLLHEDPELTLEGVGSWINGKNIKYVIAQISAANKEAAPEPKDVPLALAVETTTETENPSIS